jgi:hypothetical protein
VTKGRKTSLGFSIDKLTNSIQNRISGDSFETEVLPLTRQDLKLVTKKSGWSFNWKSELTAPGREVYKLTIINNPEIIQGLLSISFESDHVFMHLLENAPFNQGKGKLYEGVAGNLVAYACRLSFQRGFEGFVAFDAKTRLVEHYKKTLKAYQFGWQRMIIPTAPAKILVAKYFKT